MKNSLLLIFLLINLNSYGGNKDTVEIKYHDQVVPLRIQPLREVIIMRIVPSALNIYSIWGNNQDFFNYGQHPFQIMGNQPSVVSSSESGSRIGPTSYSIRGIPSFHIHNYFEGIQLNDQEQNQSYLDFFPGFSGMSREFSSVNGNSNAVIGKHHYSATGSNLNSYKSDSTRHTIGGNLGSYKSFGTFYELDLGLRRKTGLLARITEQYSEGYKNDSYYQGQSALVRFSKYFTKGNLDFRFIGGRKDHSSSWAGINDSLLEVDPRKNMNLNQKNHSENYFFQLNYTNKIHNDFNYYFTTYYFKNSTKNHLDTNANYFSGILDTLPTTYTQLESDNFGLNANFHYESNYYNRFLVGIHGIHYSGKHAGFDDRNQSLYTNTSIRQTLIPYAKWFNTKYKLKINLEASYKFSALTYTDDVPLTKQDWNYLTLFSKFDFSFRNHTFIYNASFVQREPTRMELFNGFDRLLQDSLGNPYLSSIKPEQVIDQEFGWYYSKTERFKISINLYLMNFKNERVLTGEYNAMGMATTTPTTTSFRSGAEMNADYQIRKQWKLENKSSFNYSRLHYQDNVYTPVLTPSLIINQEVVYILPEWKFSAFGKYQGSSFVDLQNTQSISGFYTVGVSAMYFVKNFSAKVRLNNLTNQSYCNTGYIGSNGELLYQPQAAINYQVAVTWTF